MTDQEKTIPERTTGLGRRFGARVRKVRSIKGLSVSRLAAMAGMAPMALSRIELGTRGVKLEEAIALTLVLGVSLEEMCLAGRVMLKSEDAID